MNPTLLDLKKPMIHCTIVDNMLQIDDTIHGLYQEPIQESWFPMVLTKEEAIELLKEIVDEEKYQITWKEDHYEMTMTITTFVSKKIKKTQTLTIAITQKKKVIQMKRIRVKKMEIDPIRQLKKSIHALQNRLAYAPISLAPHIQISPKTKKLYWICCTKSPTYVHLYHHGDNDYRIGPIENYQKKVYVQTYEHATPIQKLDDRYTCLSKHAFYKDERLDMLQCEDPYVAVVIMSTMDWNIFSYLPELEELYIIGYNSSIPQASFWKQLHILHLLGCGCIGIEEIEFLEQCQNLEELWIDGTTLPHHYQELLPKNCKIY